MIDYICANCKCKFQFSKDRSRCPNCNKNKLIETELLSGLSPTLTKEDKRTASSEKIFKENRFVDDGTQCVEDLEFNKKIRFKVSPREARKSSITEVKCHSCGSVFETRYPEERRCKRCCNRG